MDFSKLAPWNWFKKEEESTKITPVRHDDKHAELPAYFHDLHREFNRLFDTLRNSFNMPHSHVGPLVHEDWFKPSLDIALDENEYSVHVELPGMDAGNISLEYSENVLKIKGEKRQQTEQKEKDFYRIERSYGSFERILDIPDDADTDNISSHYKDGVLNITIPRKELPKKEVKKIEVKTDS